jgi:eukaryotic-like serine/threonine-protein kinase
VLGTPHYMAPEAIIASSTVDARTDLYALGATAYYLLTGKHVFDGGNFLTISSQHLYETPPKLREKRADVPEALETAILACLEKKADDRPRSADVLAEMLRACGMPEWTRADARGWWEAEPRTQQSAARARARLDRSGTTTELGDTVAIALEHRETA